MDDVTWQCPKCGGTELEVRISTWAKLEQTLDEPSNMFQTLADECSNGDHEWDEKSDMQCRDCSYCGKSRRFQVLPGPEGTMRVSRIKKRGAK